jgi:hypothetical protein
MLNINPTVEVAMSDDKGFIEIPIGDLHIGDSVKEIRLLGTAAANNIYSRLANIPVSVFEHPKSLGRGMSNSALTAHLLDVEDLFNFKIPSGDTHEDGLTLSLPALERLGKHKMEEFVINLEFHLPVTVILGNGGVLQYWSHAGAEEARKVRGKKVK